MSGYATLATTEPHHLTQTQTPVRTSIRAQTVEAKRNSACVSTLANTSLGTYRQWPVYHRSEHGVVGA